MGLILRHYGAGAWLGMGRAFGAVAWAAIGAGERLALSMREALRQRENAIVENKS
jgi:hypothetical protein